MPISSPATDATANRARLSASGSLGVWDAPGKKPPISTIRNTARAKESKGNSMPFFSHNARAAWLWATSSLLSSAARASSRKRLASLVMARAYSWEYFRRERMLLSSRASSPFWPSVWCFPVTILLSCRIGRALRCESSAEKASPSTMYTAQYARVSS